MLSAGTKAMGDSTCFKCGRVGWVWWYAGPATETGQDNNRYMCDWCQQEQNGLKAEVEELKTDHDSTERSQNQTQ